MAAGRRGTGKSVVVLFFYSAGLLDKQLRIFVLYFFNVARRFEATCSKLEETNRVEGMKLEDIGEQKMFTENFLTLVDVKVSRWWRYRDERKKFNK